MTFVVTAACPTCQDTSCVDVCPMDCFHKGEHFLIIDPDGCTDCSMCVPDCPVAAIAGANEIAESQRHFIAVNARLAKDPQWMRITKSKPGKY
jgi:ferredoxin